MEESLSVDEVKIEAFAHELAKLVRELGYNDKQLRKMYNQVLLHKDPKAPNEDYRFFMLLIMYDVGKRKTPKREVTADHFHTIDTIEAIWWKMDDEASERLFKETYFLLFTTYR